MCGGETKLKYLCSLKKCEEQSFNLKKRSTSLNLFSFSICLNDTCKRRYKATKPVKLLCCSSSFMFRSKRNSLVKRLWKHRVTLTKDETTSTNQNAEDLELKYIVQSMLKRLKENQLTSLVQAVESRGGDTTTCVLVPKGDRRTVAPQVLCCQLWRWPDVKHPFELKKLACCESTNDSVDICCNPYHWSRLCKAGMLILLFVWVVIGFFFFFSSSYELFLKLKLIRAEK